VASLPAGQSGVPAPGAERGQAPLRLIGRLADRLNRWLEGQTGRRLLAAGILVALALLVFHFDHKPRADILDPVPDTVRALAATLVLFGVGGFGLVRLLLPQPLRDYELLWVLPTGACAVGLAMTVLGFAHVPYPVSLGLVLAAGGLAGTLGVRRHGWPEPQLRSLAWPGLVAAVTLVVALIPVLGVQHFLSPVGTGSDSHVAAGTALFLQHAYPTGVDIHLPINQVPPTWQSKYPIYYAFAGVSSLSGLATYQVLPVLAAVLLSLAAVGMFLLARQVLRAPVGVATAAMFAAGLDRMALFTVLNPYFNQTWGFVTLPYTVVLGWWVVQPGLGRGRRQATLALLALFAIILVFAYPLAAPIPAVPILAFAFLERRRRIAAGQPVWRPTRLYHGARSLVWLIPLGILLAVPVAGVIDKSIGAAKVLLPGSNLWIWAGDLTGYFPFNYFLSLPSSLWYLILVVPIFGLAAWGLARQQPAIKWGLGGLLAIGLLAAWYFRLRAAGWYFEFKILAFLGPLIMLMAVAGAARVRRYGPALIAGLCLITLSGAFLQVRNLGYQLPEATIQLQDFARAVPAGASIRLDMPAAGTLWAAYFLAARPVCSQTPLLGTDYPHIAVSRKADYIVSIFFYPRPADAIGPPLMQNQGYALYRENPAVPGPSYCTFRRFDHLYTGAGYSPR